MIVNFCLGLASLGAVRARRQREGEEPEAAVGLFTPVNSGRAGQLALYGNQDIFVAGHPHLWRLWLNSGVWFPNKFSYA